MPTTRQTVNSEGVTAQPFEAHVGHADDGVVFDLCGQRLTCVTRRNHLSLPRSSSVCLRVT
jgi:hypothetical protein